MANSRRAAALTISCLLAAAIPACSTHDDGAGTDSGADAGVGACHQAPVWDSTSLSFSLLRRPSYFTNDVRTYEFSLAGPTLTRQGCRADAHVDRSLSLSDGELAAVVNAVGALQTTCEQSCGTDSPDLVLTIHADSGDRTYHPDQICIAPWIPVDDMTAFEKSLDAVLDGASAAMDGGVEAAARCPVYGLGD